MTTPPEDLLSAYLDGELAADERTVVEGRLEESAEWREVLVELRETRALLRALPVHEAPVGFWGGLLEPDVEAPIQLDDHRSKKKNRTRFVGWLAGGAAAAAIVAVVMVPGETTVKPAVGTLVNSHAARSSVTGEPVSELAPVATPVKLGR